MALAVILAGTAVFTGHATAADRPNIVFVLADDLGWAELGCYGNTFNETPHLNRLAREGVRLTQAYAAAPVCSPYRAALLTGQYPARVGLIMETLERLELDDSTVIISPATTAARPM
jgi:arylsulfatase A-like enzyme